MLKFENKKIQTADLNPILLKISSVQGGLQRNKRKGQTKKNDLSSMVIVMELFSNQKLILYHFDKNLL